MLIKDVFPKAHLEPPATESDIAAAEESIGIRLPEQLRKLYLECNGFREDKGNAQYLFPLAAGDSSLVRITKFMWTDFAGLAPDFKPYVFFGASGADEVWAMNWQQPTRVIKWHHHMCDEYEVVSPDILVLWQADYAAYPE